MFSDTKEYYNNDLAILIVKLVPIGTIMYYNTFTGCFVKI